MPVEITLGADPVTGEGGVTVPVYEQRHAYIINRLGRWFTGLGSSLQGMAPGDILSMAGSEAYGLVVAVIPTVEKRMSEWEFRGFASREAMEAGDYNPALDMTSPSIPEIKNAIRVGGEVVGLDVFVHLKTALGQFVDPTVLRALVSEKLMEAVDSVSMTSPSSPSETGDSPSTSSGMSPRTSTETEGSRSLDFAA